MTQNTSNENKALMTQNTDRQTDRQTDTHTHTLTHSLTHTVGHKILTTKTTDNKKQEPKKTLTTQTQIAQILQTQLSFLLNFALVDKNILKNLLLSI